MVTETDRNKARSAVVSAYHALDCVTIPFPFLHAFADAAVDAVSTDAEPATMDDEDRTPMPAGFDDALWRKADEVHHAMALVARDQECVKIIYAALSTHNAEPVKTAPAVAVKALEWDDEEHPASKCIFGHYVIHPGYCHVELLIGYGRGSMTSLGRIQLDRGASIAELKDAAQDDYEARILSALSAQVQDVAVPDGWQIVPKELTPEMADELNLTGNFSATAMQARYAAALAKAPVPPALTSVLESNPGTLRWWCQQLLDIIENYDISHDAPEEEIALLNDIRAAVDPASPASKHGDEE